MNSEQTVAEIGEFALIDLIAARLKPQPSASDELIVLGAGDDSAVIQVPGGQVVACLDVLNEGIHFRRDWSEPYDIGRKAAAQNLADICAMGAQPSSLLVGLVVPSETPVSWVLKFAEGLRDEAAIVGAQVVGGDLSRGDTISISVTALGHLSGRPPITRGGAKVGDVVAVAGKLGYSAAGLLMLSRGFRSPRALVNAHRVPEPPYELALEATYAHSMIDVSDGLISDLGHIAKASNVSISLNLDAFEVSEDLAAAASVFNGDAMQWILNGGEDHAFVATFANALDVPPGWLVIGSVHVGEPAVVIDGVVQTPRGWDHFTRS